MNSETSGYKIEAICDISMYVSNNFITRPNFSQILSLSCKSSLAALTLSLENVQYVLQNEMFANKALDKLHI